MQRASKSGISTSRGVDRDAHDGVGDHSRTLDSHSSLEPRSPGLADERCNQADSQQSEPDR